MKAYIVIFNKLSSDSIRDGTLKYESKDIENWKVVSIGMIVSIYIFGAVYASFASLVVYLIIFLYKDSLLYDFSIASGTSFITLSNPRTKQYNN